MILQWMAYAALCAAIFGLAAASVDSILAGRRRARRGVWMTAIGASVLVPLALPLLLSSTAEPTAPTASNTIQETSPVVAAASVSVDVVVLSVWGLTSLVFAAFLLVAHRRTTRALRRCHAGTIAGRTAFVSQDFGPAVVGLLRHHIVVPAWTLALDDAEQELVVAHELEHAHSGDPMLALAGVCAVVAMPWNVALWWQLSRLRLAIELDCDARVIARRHHDALTYTKLLLSVGERVRHTRHPVLAMSRSRSALAKRFDALLGREVIAPRKAVGLVGLAMGLLASVAFVPAPSVLEIVNLVRPPRAEPVGVVQRAQSASTANAANIVSAAPIAPSAAAAAQRPPRAVAPLRRRPVPPIDMSTLPPVRVVPPTASSGSVDWGVVAQAAAVRPTMRAAGGAIFGGAGGSGGARGRGGFVSARPVTADSNVITARGGGRAALIARPDTIRPPR
jgi:beta-lactamase regulating signal transducer with metallopeptidase domain